MSISATPSDDDSVLDDSLLDELVPPARPRLLGGVAWVAFMGVLAATIWAWTSGTATPSIRWSAVRGFGGAGPVHLQLDIHNESRVDIEVTDGPAARPGLRLLGYALGNTDPTAGPPTAQQPTDAVFPLRLAPDERALLTIWFEVTDCEALRQPDHEDTRVDLQVRIADGPLSAWTRTRSIAADLDGTTGTLELGGARPTPSSWPSAITEFACP